MKLKLPQLKSSDKHTKKSRQVKNSSGMRVNSLSQHPSSSRRNRKKPDNKRAKSRFKRSLLRIVLISGAVVVVGFVGWNNLRVKHVIVSNQQEDGKYVQTIERYLGRNPVANLKPLVSTKAITEDIMSAFPEVSGVNLTIPLIGERLEADIIIRDDRLVLKTGNDNYYIVDQDGYAYARYDKERGFDNTLVLSDDTAVDYTSDGAKQFVAPSLVKFIQLINKNLSAIDQYKGQVFSYRLTDEARVIYAKPSSSKYEIKFSQDTSVEQQIDNLKNALMYLKTKSISPKRYIDVRINGTTYYK